MKTDNEIIKALGPCNTSVCADCEECPYTNENLKNTINILKTDLKLALNI